MKTPLVTVLTTTYNHSKFIADCIKSVLAQTYQNWEQVIVDDGSTDDTEEIINKFDDERIVYVRQKHVGVHRLSETYNRGLRLAKGDFIAILEGDDMYPKRKVELQIGSLDDGAVLSFGKCMIINQDKRVLGITPVDARQYITMTDWLKSLLIHDYITAVTTMIRKEALIKIGGFTQPQNTSAVDYSTFLELALVGKFRFVNEVLGIWVKHGDNYSDRELSSFDTNNAFSDVAMRYSIPFCKRHDIPVDWKALSRQMGKDIFHVARHQLLDGRRNEAIQSFKQAFRMSSTGGKFKSVAGIVISKFGLDLERITGMFGRPTER
jgi:glycosyltransferase involved in cell wall biosynthesis